MKNDGFNVLTAEAIGSNLKKIKVVDCHGTHELGWPSKFLTSKNHINPRHPGFFDLGKNTILCLADFLEMICLGTIGKMRVYIFVEIVH